MEKFHSSKALLKMAGGGGEVCIPHIPLYPPQGGGHKSKKQLKKSGIDLFLLKLKFKRGS